MVKGKQKTLITENNQNNTLLEYKNDPLKSRQEVNQSYYQKHKEKLKSQRREKYQQQKQQIQLSTKQQSAKYYQAEAIKVLMSFKDYTELSKQTRKKWLDFNSTLKDINQGITGIVDIMKLRESADNFINDFWAIAKSEAKQKSKSWNSLDYDQQQKLARYWGYEKARIEEGYIDEEERLARQGESYLKEIERAKFHEERGKVNCNCYDCEAKQGIQVEIKEKLKKDATDYDRQSKASDKEKCPECGEIRILDEVAGVCKSCKKKYE